MMDAMGGPARSANGSKGTVPADRPVLLVVHEDEAVFAELARTLNNSGHMAVLGVPSADAALRHVRAGHGPVTAVLVQWDHSETSGGALVEALRAAAGVRAPFVLAVSGRWDADEIVRADLLGVQGFYVPPIAPAQVVADLVALWQGRRAPSHEVALEAASSAPSRRGGPDEAWRERMIELAASTPRGGSRRSDRVPQLVRRLEETLAGPLQVVHLEGLLLRARRDERQLEHLVAAGDVDRPTIEALYAAAADFVGLPPDSPVTRASVHAWADAALLWIRARRGQGDWTPEYEALRRHALRMLQQNACDRPDHPENEGFRQRLGALLRLDPGYLLRLDGLHVRCIAARIVKAAAEGPALDYARLVILAFILRAHRTHKGQAPEAADRVALASLLGRPDRTGSGVMERLRALAADLAGPAHGGGEDREVLPDPGTFEAFCASWERLAGRPRDEDGPAEPAAHPFGDPSAPPPLTAAARRLFRRLADHLDLPLERLLSSVTRELADRTPRFAVPDLRLDGEVTTVLRLAAALAATTGDGAVRGEVLAAVAERHGDAPQACVAMLRFLDAAGGDEAHAAFRRLLGLPPGPCPVDRLHAFADARDWTRAFVAAFDGPAMDEARITAIEELSRHFGRAGRISEATALSWRAAELRAHLLAAESEAASTPGARGIPSGAETFGRAPENADPPVCGVTR